MEISVHEQLVRLLETFEKDVRRARELNSSTDDTDDLAINAAMIGFSYNSPMDEWSYVHREFVQDRLLGHFVERGFDRSSHISDNVRLFYTLGTGYLLGLSHQEMIDDEGLRIGELRLSGLIMLNHRQLMLKDLDNGGLS